jgi:PAS domain S-box-containing protein
MKNRIEPTSVERVMREDDFIVSKTDLKGRITYGNRIFIEFSGYTERELLGSQHNIIRHPDMPRGVFKFLWDTIQAKEECMAFVKNMSKDGGYYWVFAVVTPDFDAAGQHIGYYSVRRKPHAAAVRLMEGVYREMKAIESRAGAREATSASLDYLTGLLRDKGVTYGDFMIDLQMGRV